MTRRWPFASRHAMTLGTYGPFAMLPLRVPLPRVKTHWHVIGKTGSGKSRFLAHLFLSLLEHQLPATLIDPHGDLSRLILATLVARGAYRTRSDIFDRLIYLDLPAAEAHERYLPFNVLKRDGHSDAIASDVKDACHRAWPELAQGAATFDTLLPDAVELLMHHGLPLIFLQELLTNDDVRERLLDHETDPFLVSSFRNVYNQLRKYDQVAYAGSVLRRARQLTRVRVLRYGLGQDTMLLDYKRIINEGKSVIINLKLQSTDAQRLLGCFLTVAAEQGAQARADTVAENRHGSHHLILDECFLFTAQDSTTLSHILSQTRKYGLHLVMAHQTWNQIPEGLRGSLQNCDVDVVFRLGRADAEDTSPMVAAAPNLLTVKDEVVDAAAKERTHPTFYPLSELRELDTQGLTDMWQGEATVTLHTAERPPWWVRLSCALLNIHRTPRRVVKVWTPYVPDPRVNARELAAVEHEYLHRYFRHRTEIERDLKQYPHQPPAPPARSVRLR
jgi:hypothetical protein